MSVRLGDHPWLASAYNVANKHDDGSLAKTWPEVEQITARLAGGFAKRMTHDPGTFVGYPQAGDSYTAQLRYAVWVCKY